MATDSFIPLARKALSLNNDEMLLGILPEMCLNIHVRTRSQHKELYLLFDSVSVFMLVVLAENSAEGTDPESILSCCMSMQGQYRFVLADVC